MERKKKKEEEIAECDGISPNDHARLSHLDMYAGGTAILMDGQTHVAPYKPAVIPRHWRWELGDAIMRGNKQSNPELVVPQVNKTNIPDSSQAGRSQLDGAPVSVKLVQH